MIASEIKIKPLSVNEAYRRKRYKTVKYKVYEEELLYKLPNLKIDKESKLFLTIVAGLSNRNADLSNIIKPFEDVLQIKYNFNDNKIYKINMTKEIVKKGKEFIRFNLDSL